MNTSGLGFPSGHAALAAAVVVAAPFFLPHRWRASVLLFPVFMAFARVYVDAHLPLDVVSGAAIGAATASALYLALGVPLTRSADPPVVAPKAPQPAHAELWPRSHRLRGVGSCLAGQLMTIERRRR
jgi:membrane-associated phospholipid phosphatase